MDFKFILPASITIPPQNQQPKPIFFQQYPTHQAAFFKPNLNSANKTNPPIYLNARSSSISCEKDIAKPSGRKQSSPQVKFNYVSNQSRNGWNNSNRRISSNNQPLKKQTNYGGNPQKNHSKSYEKKEKKITNLVYTEDQYKQINDKSGKKKQFQALEMSTYQREWAELDNLFQQKKKKQNYLKEETKIQFASIEKVKSEILQESQRTSNEKIKLLQEKNKELLVENERKDKQIKILKEELEQYQKGEGGEEGNDAKLREKDLEIKKLKNQLALMKLREKELESSVHRLSSKKENEGDVDTSSFLPAERRFI